MLLQLELLNKYGIVNPFTIIYGLQRNWVTKNDMILFAVQWLISNEFKTDRMLAVIAGGEDLTDEDLIELFKKYTEKNIGSINEEKLQYEKNKWRWAFLNLVLNSSLAEYEMFMEILEILADFGGPEDMQNCNKFEQKQINDQYLKDKIYVAQLVEAKLRAQYINCK